MVTPRVVEKPRDFHSLLERSQEFGGAWHGGITVGVTSTPIIQGYNYRRKLTLINDGANVIYIAKGAPAVLNEGIRLNANGGSYEETPDNLGYIYRGPINGIAAANTNICFCEEF